MRLLYVDAVAGLAGDMLLGALLHAGASEQRVRDGLAALGVRLEVGRAERHGISAHTVRMSGDSGHVHRTWRDVKAILDGAELPARAATRAHATFARLAEAEGRIHDMPAEDVHFHEVGALDAIGDVVGIALALEELGVDTLACSPLPMPRGFVTAAHGRLPLPAPATLELLKGAPIHGVDLDVELVTPTGAAVVSALATEFGALPPMRLESVGYGAGQRDIAALPNIVRVLAGAALDAGASPVLLLETNLDDLLPELVPDAVEKCFAAGALDVWTTPVHMKKGRPGVVLSALARPAHEQAVAETMLRETTALGVRVTRTTRHELERDWQTVRVQGERVRLKLGRLRGEVVNVAPEHGDVAAAARATGRPAKEIWAAALAQHER